MSTSDISGDSGGNGQGHFTGASGAHVEIRDVWASNLEEEMEKIREIVEKYPYVAMVERELTCRVCVYNIFVGY